MVILGRVDMFYCGVDFIVYFLLNDGFIGRVIVFMFLINEILLYWYYLDNGFCFIFLEVIYGIRCKFFDGLKN